MMPLITLKQILSVAERNGYAIGAFAPRYTPMIRPVLLAAQADSSPAIVQISQNEFNWYQVTPAEFGAEFKAQMQDLAISVPITLHLDHTRDMEVIAAAIDAGFTSVMIDMSAKPLMENIAISREVTAYAHSRGVSVEAELGRIGTTDFVETDEDEELYTNPEEAGIFVRETGIDALAVSVGTAHGVYNVRKPRVDLERLRAIRAQTGVHLVLHGGSGVPASMIHPAINLPGGGISKVNIATDLEVAVLTALGREKRMTNAECRALPADDLERARDAVRATVHDKIRHFVLSADRAGDYA
jgi:fructose-bisphosphate aldolase class II